MLNYNFENIIIIIIIIIISFMQVTYAYFPETNYVPRKYSVAAILLLLFMVLIPLVSVLNLLYFYITTFRSMCAVPNMAVFWLLLLLRPNFTYSDAGKLDRSRWTVVALSYNCIVHVYVSYESFLPYFKLCIL